VGGALVCTCETRRRIAEALSNAAGGNAGGDTAPTQRPRDVSPGDATHVCVVEKSRFEAKSCDAIVTGASADHLHDIVHHVTRAHGHDRAAHDCESRRLCVVERAAHRGATHRDPDNLSFL